MASLNRCMLMGNLTRDPELKYTPQGTAVCKFGLAVGRKFKLQDGQMQEQTTFFNIVVWGKSAENVSKYLSKGRPVFIEGRIDIRDYEDKEGNKRKVTEIVADQVQFLGQRPSAGDQAGGQTEHGAAKANGYQPDGEQQLDESGDVPF